MYRSKFHNLILIPFLFVLVSCVTQNSSSDTSGTGGNSSSANTSSDNPSSTDSSSVDISSDTEVPNDPHWVYYNTHCSATLEAVFTSRVETMPIVSNGSLMLAGWFLEETYQNIVSFPFRVLEDVTLHAKWTEGNPADFTFSSTLDGAGYIVTSYGGNATNVIVPSYYSSKPVLEIGEYLFANNGALLSVTMPSMLIKINMAAFKNAIQLSSIVIPDNVTSIGTDAFMNCAGLQAVSMPNRLEVVGNSAFEGTAMQSVTLGSRVSSINSRAFADCASLRNVFLDNLTPPLRFANSFENTDSALRYKVDSSALNAYKTNEYWAPFASQIVAR